ncbi:MAG: hypothetical protein FWH18_07200 [Marinilabiliaceae bacterium]|nr:hypothetical protein [Marinilabiliaceae bacterium]
MENQKYWDFCADIKREYGLNINPDDEIFPLLYKLITLNNENSAIIGSLKKSVEESLEKIENSNNNLYSNQTTLLDKNNELLSKQEKALQHLYPKQSILFNNPETVRAYWKEKTKFFYFLIFGLLSLLVVGTASVMAVSKTYKVQKFMQKVEIVKDDNGERFIIFEKANSEHEAQTGNYFILDENSVVVPIDR